MLKLTRRLQDDYEVVGDKVVNKKKYCLDKPDGTKFEIPNDWFWVLRQMSRDDKELVTNASKILTHPACLKLAKEFGFDASKMETKWVCIPSEDNEHRAAVEIRYPGCVPIIGEASPSSLNSNMKSYIMTMALKRGADKIITHISGVYVYGFYSQSETGGSFSDGAVEGEVATATTAVKTSPAVKDRNYDW